MSWNAPMTYVSGTVLTASQMNTYVSGNINVLKTNIADDGTLRSLNLLHASSGNTTTTGTALNLDTQAISGLTAKDKLVIEILAESLTAGTTEIRLYNSTDSVTIARASAGGVSAGEVAVWRAVVHQSPRAATRIACEMRGSGTVNNDERDLTVSTFTQNWTGSWTLALRTDGLGATAQLYWAWNVYRLAGQ